MLKSQKHMLEEKQLISPNQLMQLKNSVEAIHRQFRDLSQSPRNGSNTIGTPLGTKSFKYPKPCLIKPIMVTPIKMNAASINVTIM